MVADPAGALSAFRRVRELVREVADPAGADRIPLRPSELARVVADPRGAERKLSRAWSRTPPAR